MNENGRVGGGSLNLAGLQDSLIQNNLIYDNLNHGIAQWNDANPYDEAYVDPGPLLPEQVRGPDDLPLWGCHDNIIRNNTVLMDNHGRSAMQASQRKLGDEDVQQHFHQRSANFDRDLQHQHLPPGCGIGCGQYGRIT